VIIGIKCRSLKRVKSADGETLNLACLSFFKGIGVLMMVRTCLLLYGKLAMLPA